MTSIEPSPNPYAAPQASLTAVAPDPRSWWVRIVDECKLGAWLLVFLLNLGVPVLLGFSLCSNDGRLGVVLTIVFLLLLTTIIVSRNHELRRRWLTGSWVVAVLQFFPIVHLILGTVSLKLLVLAGLVNDMTKPDDVPNFGPIDFWPACLLTLMVGGGLLVIAFLVGWMIPHRPREDRETAAS